MNSWLNLLFSNQVPSRIRYNPLYKGGSFPFNKINNNPSQKRAPNYAPQVTPNNTPQINASPPINNSPPQANASSGEGDKIYFIQKLFPYAKLLESQTGVPAVYSLAMAANETGWNPDNSTLFGIKGESPSGNSGTFSTWEDYGNGPTTIQDKFATYTNPQEAFDQLGYNLSSDRYKGFPTNDPHAFGQWMQSRGWATDPAYADKIGWLAPEILNILKSTN